MNKEFEESGPKLLYTGTKALSPLLENVALAPTLPLMEEPGVSQGEKADLFTGMKSPRVFGADSFFWRSASLDSSSSFLRAA